MPNNGFGGFGGLANNMMRIFKPKEAKLTTWTFVAQVRHKVMVAIFQFKHHVAPLPLLGCLHRLHLLVLYMVGFLCLALTHEQPTWFDKCVESYTLLPFMVHELHEVSISFMYHESKLQVNFPFFSKTMCIHLLGDSNTKCTHLGGVHPMVCDFETNMFASLSFVAS